MFKFLPPDEHNKVEHEYKLRRRVIFVLAFSIICIVAIAGLFPTYVALTSREATLRDELLSSAQSPDSNADQTIKTWAQNERKKLDLITPSKDTDTPFESFETLLNARGNGIVLKTLSWKHTTKLDLSVGGTADTRADLLTFENNLANSHAFASTTFPVSDLAQSTGVDFSFDLTPSS